MDTLTIKEVAATSGRKARAVRDLVKRGTLSNEGETGSPKIGVDHRLDYWLREQKYESENRVAPAGYVWPKEYAIRTTTVLGQVYDMINSGELSTHPSNEIAIAFGDNSMSTPKTAATPTAKVSKPSTKKVTTSVALPTLLKARTIEQVAAELSTINTQRTALLVELNDLVQRQLNN